MTQQLEEESRARQALQAAHASLGLEHATTGARSALLKAERNSLAGLLRSYEATGDPTGMPLGLPAAAAWSSRHAVHKRAPGQYSTQTEAACGADTSALAMQQLAALRTEQAAARSYAQQLEQQLASEGAAAAASLQAAQSAADVAKTHASGLETQLDAMAQELAEMQASPAHALPC